MFEWIKDFYFRHPIINTLILLFLVYSFFSTITTSMALWNAHPKRLECSKSENKCVVITYSYRHEICWEYLFDFLSRHNYRGTSCKIPKYVESTVEVTPFLEITDVVVKQENNNFNLYLVGQKGKKSFIYGEKDEYPVNRRASRLKSRIEEYKNPPSALDEFLLNNERIMTYEFY